MKQATPPITPPRRKRRWLRRILIGFLSILLVLVLLTGFGLYWFMIRPLPQTSGTLQVSGFKDEVKVIRDKWGVPHIYATSTEDLFMAQGYVTAQDRLWQMEFDRRIGAGRLSEVLGSAALKQDRFLRTIGLRRAAQAEMDGLSQESRQILDSYARGVNAFIDSHKDNLPIEFTLLGFKPEPWTPLDSMTWAKVMSYDLSGNYPSEILRANIVNSLGVPSANDLLPLTGGDNNPLIVPPGVSYANLDAARELIDLQQQTLALAGADLDTKGSNNWVVSGAKSTTGQPLLANDPHLGISNPSIWYEIELNGAGWHVAGLTFPATPGVVVGHNDRIAWGVTNATGDTQDLYIEKVNPDNPHQYQYKGRWFDMQVLNEQINVKGQGSELMEVRLTNHGPIMNDVSSSMKNSQPLALRWTALDKSPILDAVLKYDRARNWNEFRDALRGFNTPAQNFVYADIDGNIGYQLPGLWPLRVKGHDGLTPVPGWTGEYEWTGYANFDELPHAYNPPAGFIATANNRQVPNDFSPNFVIGQEFDPGWRAARITTLLKAKEKLSPEDMQAIQADVVSIPDHDMAGYLAKLPNADPQTRQLLQNWDGALTTDSVAASLEKVTYQHLLENLLKDRLGQFYEDYAVEPHFHILFIENILKDPQNRWWGSGGRDAALSQALQQAITDLKGRLGANMNDWQWGKLHQASFAETPIGPALPGPLAALINLKAVPTKGDSTTVAAASYDFTEPYNQTSGQSFRAVYNLASFDDSALTNTAGQSGQPFSKHYGDNLDDWANARYHRLLFSPQAVDAQPDKEVLILKP